MYFLPQWFLLGANILFADSEGQMFKEQLLAWVLVFACVLFLLLLGKELCFAKLSDRFAEALNTRVVEVCTQRAYLITLSEVEKLTRQIDVAKSLVFKTLPRACAHLLGSLAGIVTVLVMSWQLGLCILVYACVQLLMLWLRDDYAEALDAEMAEIKEAKAIAWPAVVLGKRPSALRVLELASEERQLQSKFFSVSASLDALQVTAVATSPIIVAIMAVYFPSISKHYVLLSAAYFLYTMVNLYFLDQTLRSFIRAVRALSIIS
jgi:hypothetical protein